jgi:V8-like Glu-specific endopeptidase
MEKEFRMKMTILASVLTLISLSASAHNKFIDVIYGEDNRVDVYDSKNSAFVELSKSTAGMIANENIKKSKDGFDIQAKTLKERGVCESERFSTQMFAANCSGFLVGEDLLVTAGHCITSMDSCEKYKWVFDYKMDSATQDRISVEESSVYTCKKIISRELNQVSQNDYALVQLDRKVTDRRPLTFRKTGKVAKGDSLVVIGHPTGLPTKIADGAKVRSLSKIFFVANLDTYGGNSGSAVINTATSEVEGILVRGDTDYVKDSKKGCMVSNLCKEDSCRGEDVTYITNIKELVKN